MGLIIISSVLGLVSGILITLLVIHYSNKKMHKRVNAEFAQQHDEEVRGAEEGYKMLFWGDMSHLGEIHRPDFSTDRVRLKDSSSKEYTKDSELPALLLNFDVDIESFPHLRQIALDGELKSLRGNINEYIRGLIVGKVRTLFSQHTASELISNQSLITEALNGSTEDGILSFEVKDLQIEVTKWENKAASA